MQWIILHTEKIRLHLTEEVFLPIHLFESSVEQLCRQCTSITHLPVLFSKCISDPFDMLSCENVEKWSAPLAVPTKSLLAMYRRPYKVSNDPTSCIANDIRRL